MGKSERWLWEQKEFCELPENIQREHLAEARKADRMAGKARRQSGKIRQEAVEAAKEAPKVTQEPPAAYGGFGAAEMAELQRLYAALEIAQAREAAQADFLTFCKRMVPSLLIGAHHKMLAEKLVEIESGKIRRLIINAAPRHGKSMFTNELFVPWYLGRNPSHKIIVATHTAELSERFGRKVRNMIQSDEYQKVFPGVTVRADSKAAGRWEIIGPNKEAGEAFYAGVGGALAGRGADLFLIDDPYSEQDLSANAMDSVWDWYSSGPRQRLQPGGKICLIQTRWSQKDLSERLMRQAENDPKADQWDVLRLPAILPSGKPLWPEWFTIEELEAIKASNYAKWQGQWMQDPTSEEGAIIRREWWKVWEKDRPPPVDYIITSYDTAFMKSSRHDYTAITTWGVWYTGEYGDKARQPNLILLDVVKERMEFPELKKFAINHYRNWQPDLCIIEAKASGLPLIQELRAIGLPISTFTPTRGNDKVARANQVSAIIEAGIVWIPDTQWAWELVEELAEFPNGEHDDLVDSTVLALMRYRQGGFITLGDDEPEEEIAPQRAAYY